MTTIIMAFSITTLRIMSANNVTKNNNTQHNIQVLLSKKFNNFAQCHLFHGTIMLRILNTDCSYAEYRYAMCHLADWHYAECHYADCHYAECHYADCHYT